MTGRGGWLWGHQTAADLRSGCCKAVPTNLHSCLLARLQVPVFDWRVLAGAVRRIDLGGKALTNFMKELVSYR
jgi:hypothetical protein